MNQCRGKILAALRLATAAAALNCAPGEQASAQPSTLKALLAAQACPIAGQLKATHDRLAETKEHGRFFVVSVANRPRDDVRCLFADEGRRLYCETYAGKDAAPAVQKLGFSARTESKFVHESALRRLPDFDAIAALMLTVLHDAYGVRDDTRLTIVGPMQGSVVVACAR